MKLTKLFIIILFTGTVVSAQFMDPPPAHGKGRKKIEQLEKIKLLEILDLEEDVMLKFFARKKKHRDELQGIMEERKERTRKLERAVKGKIELSEKELSELVDEILNYENKFIESRNKFVTSLNELLSKKQIAKYLIFEIKFRKEIRDHLMDKMPKRRQRNRR